MVLEIVKYGHPALRQKGASRSAMAMADNTASSARTKHIDLAIHNIRSTVARQILTLHFVPTADNVADHFTKPLGPQLFLRHVAAMGMS